LLVTTLWREWEERTVATEKDVILASATWFTIAKRCPENREKKKIEITALKMAPKTVILTKGGEGEFKVSVQ